MSETTPRHPGFDFLTKAALVLLVFQIAVFANFVRQQGLGDAPNSITMMMMSTALFLSAQRRCVSYQIAHGGAPWLVASRAAALAILAIGSLAIVFKDYLRPPLPAITLQAVFSMMWAVIALKGAAAGKFRPGGIGLRVYWTLHSRLAWEKAHRALGRVLFWGGLLGFAASFFIPPLNSIALWFVTVASAVAIALVEAWRAWRADPERA